MTETPDTPRRRPHQNCGKGHPGSFGNGAHRLCGRIKRNGEPCKKAAMKGRKRCRSHGGAAIPTPEGRLRQRRAVTKHGKFAAPGNPLRLEKYGTDTAGPLWNGHRERRGRITKRDIELLARAMKEGTI